MKSHLSKHRAFYAWLPLSIGLLLGSIAAYHLLTGRAPSDPSSQPDALIALAYRFMVCVVALALTDLVKTKQTLNRAFEPEHFDSSVWKFYATSRAQTVLLIALFSYVLTH